nr:unnamed protein product [Callosobruchus analis]
MKSCIQWHLDILVVIKKIQNFCGNGASAVSACDVLNICTSLALVIKVSCTEVFDVAWFS